MNELKIVTFASAVYVMFVSLFYFSQHLTLNAIEPKKFYQLPAKSPPVTKQSSIFWEDTTQNFIKSKISDHTNDDKVAEESRLKAALEKATERVKLIEIKWGLSCFIRSYIIFSS